MKLRTYLAGVVAALSTAALVGCGDPVGQDPDGGSSTTGPARATEIVSVAGRVAGGGITLDVQIGHSQPDRRARNVPILERCRDCATMTKLRRIA